VILIITAVVLATAGVLGLTMRGGEDDAQRSASDSAVARRGDFEITVPTNGELTAMEQIEIRNRLDQRAVITEIVDEGTWVKPGDVLLRMNDDELRNKVKDAVDEVNVAEADAVAAESDLQITQKERESEIAKTTLDRQTAELALKGWEEGTDKSMRLELKLAVETAEKNMSRLSDRFAESGKLLEKKFISLDEFKQDEIAMIEARAELEKAKLEFEVYEKYKSLEERSKLQSELEQADGEQERTVQRFDAKVRQAESELASKRYQLESKRDRLKQYEQQLSYCTVTSPREGLVVYYSSLQSGGMGRGGDEGAPTVGTELPPNRTVIVLPNTSKMIAAVKVSEALSGNIKPGQKATVTSDAQPDLSLPGEVLTVGVLAESGGWRDPNRRDYTVRILLDGGNQHGLKPSMRCKADIFVERVSNALHVPIQAVFRNGPVSFVYVPQRGGYAQRKVSVGRTSELYIEIVDGLEEGQKVLLREPQPEEVLSRVTIPKGQGGSAGANGSGQGDGAPAAALMETGAPGMNAAPVEPVNGPTNGPAAGEGGPPTNSDDQGPSRRSRGPRPEGGDRPRQRDGDSAKPGEAPAAPAATGSG